MAERDRSEGSRAFKDMIGVKCNWLTPISYLGKVPNGHSLWLCLCECGNTTKVPGEALRRGAIKSCGCKRSMLISARATKHGDLCGGRISREYASWMSMIGRCTDPTHKSYAHYGGRGITVCEQWRSSYEAFLADMGRRPSPKHSLDRIDNNLGYSPENCRWATGKVQCRNRRSNTYLSLNGVRKTLIEWSEDLGIKKTTISERIRMGWSDEKILTTPVRSLRRRL